MSGEVVSRLPTRVGQSADPKGLKCCSSAAARAQASGARCPRILSCSLAPCWGQLLQNPSRLLNDPAQFVLQPREELALTMTQVTSLEQLARTLRGPHAQNSETRVDSICVEMAERFGFDGRNGAIPSA